MEMMNKKDTWVVAVSGGADSMALLDMAYQKQIPIVVAHVNYQKRETALRDMQGVQAYCEARNISCFVHCVEHYEKNVNFQAQARDIRYLFFAKVIAQTQAKGVLVAHHKDDVLETYLLQKERGSIPAYYGIKEEGMVHHILVKRPLLAYTKEALVTYCEKQGIDYFQDESNLEDAYARNAIRHYVLAKYTKMQKQQLLEEINALNKELCETQKEIECYVEGMQDSFSLSSFEKVPTILQKGVLREWLVQQGVGYHISEKNLQQFVSLIHDKKTNAKHTINGQYYLQIAYDEVFLLPRKKGCFAYSFEEITYGMYPYFTLSDTGKVIEGITLQEEDFPITIRSVKKGDKIKLRMGSKKVSRYFIDTKISHKEREIWPLVVNAKGNVIFVCGIGCDIEHYSNNPNLFVLK